MSDLEMMLPMAVTIVSHNRKRQMYDSRPGPSDWYLASYTLHLQFQNTTIETEITEQDPRYQAIKNHLKVNGVALE